MATFTKPGRAEKTRGNRKGDQTNAGKGGRTQAVKDYAGALDQDVAEEVGQEVTGSNRRGDGRSRGAHRGNRGGGVGTALTMNPGGEVTELGDTPHKRALADQPGSGKRSRAHLAKPKAGTTATAKATTRAKSTKR